MPYLLQAPFPSLHGVQCDDAFWITHNQTQAKPIQIKLIVEEKLKEEWIEVSLNKKTKAFVEKIKLAEVLENLGTALQIPETSILYSRFLKKHSRFVQFVSKVEKQIEKIYQLYREFKQYISETCTNLKKNKGSEREIKCNEGSFKALVTLDGENKPIGCIQLKKITAGTSKEIYEGINVQEDRPIVIYRPTETMQFKETTNLNIAKIFQREINAVKKLKPYVTNIVGPDFCRISEESVFAIGELHVCNLSQKIQHNEGVPEELLVSWTKQLLTITSLFQKKNCAHLDVKSDNILIDKEGNIHLCDLEFTNKIGKELDFPCGSYGYIAPEITSESENELILNQYKLQFNEYSENLLKAKMWKIPEKADSWATGCVLHEMCFGKLPEVLVEEKLSPVPLSKTKQMSGFMVKKLTVKKFDESKESKRALIANIAFKLLDPDIEKRHTVTQALDEFTKTVCK